MSPDVNKNKGVIETAPLNGRKQKLPEWKVYLWKQLFWNIQTNSNAIWLKYLFLTVLDAVIYNVGKQYVYFDSVNPKCSTKNLQHHLISFSYIHQEIAN